MRWHRQSTYRWVVSLSDNELPRTEDEWRVRLSPEEFRVLRQAGTEAPWTGEYVDTKTPGVYHCRACGLELFRSDDKFDSHCGWPSFDDAIPGAVKEIPDNTLGMRRVEIRCARCDSHLGHVFEGEGFTPKDTRHCVNSISVRLEPSAG
ncbi:peptide-methionine (R)-S-oxide reductase [Micromonospora humi]|uniref:peptide-methionine (R)-S-oxide reductase n=1 Tax=Micromonospora humi TaxID=745366 RepID=A0A1C5K348_9ACTN|nr:peptide-methionine (R)-S-oxide reductase [Micromonospora humi]